MYSPVVVTTTGREGRAAAGVRSYASVALFEQRARAVNPGFSVTAGNAEAVQGICRALDGMPLAIELAAARMRSMTAEQVAARLDDRFRLLTGGSRTALPRHQTLRAVVDWSWDLLDEGERALLRRLSVFAGGGTLEAIEQVCAGAAVAAGPAVAGSGRWRRGRGGGVGGGGGGRRWRRRMCLSCWRRWLISRC